MYINNFNKIIKVINGQMTFPFQAALTLSLDIEIV